MRRFAIALTLVLAAPAHAASVPAPEVEKADARSAVVRSTASGAVVSFRLRGGAWRRAERRAPRGTSTVFVLRPLRPGDHLLYSGGVWTGDYGMGHATAAAPTGPFERSGDGERILRGTGSVDGPGGGMIVTGPRGGEWLAYHGRSEPHPASRTLRLDPLSWRGDGAPAIAGPTSTPQPEGP